MINPQACTKYDRTRAELEEFLVFCTFVAGKSGWQAAVATHRFLRRQPPYERIRTLIRQRRLRRQLRTCGIGQYSRLTRALTEILPLDPAIVPVTVLETVYGIGPKTARFFVLHSRPAQQLAVLDIHILRELRAQGYVDAPTTTPQHPRTYARWERVVLGLATAAGMSPAAFDLMVWNRRSRNGLREAS
jgi:thermostable 8-oxoguanine DNA glycosylase